jgi:glyceraldehyde-3-phosphate dehydrogenase (NADP+)
MKMYVSGHWLDASEMTQIVSPYSREFIDVVPQATYTQVQQALAAAVEGAKAMAALTAHERSQILNRAAQALSAPDLTEDIARTLSLEAGKPITESRGEVGRIPELLRLCAFEGTQLRGESLPIDTQAGAKGKMGFTLRQPCGVVVAITPFNYPVLLVAHKIGPALAAGNAVILKPATQTSLVALKITQLLLEAGLPENGIQCLTGSGGRVCPMLCQDSRVRKISFTGSAAVGEEICRAAGVKKLSMELGANCPAIVLDDADLGTVSDAVAVGGYVNAGQVCISTQRVLVDRRVYADFLDALTPKIRNIRVGQPLDGETRLSAMISENEAKRVAEWVDEAVQGGARLVVGGEREGAVYAPTILADVQPNMRVSRDELFGPAVAVTPISGVDEAIQLANDSNYGLAAGIFTNNVNYALRFAQKAECGNVMINWTPLWRADLMPYGGFKRSGFGREGPRYAVEEMTEIKTVVFHGIDGHAQVPRHDTAR